MKKLYITTLIIFNSHLWAEDVKVGRVAGSDEADILDMENAQKKALAEMRAAESQGREIDWGFFPAISVQAGYPVGVGPVLECAFGSESHGHESYGVTGINLKIMPASHAVKADIGFGVKEAIFFPVYSFDASASYMKIYKSIGGIDEYSQYGGLSIGGHFQFFFAQLGIFRKIDKSSDPGTVGMFSIGLGI